MKPNQISAETALKLSEMLKVPVEHLMHMPKHILLAKMAELAAQMPAKDDAAGGATPPGGVADTPGNRDTPDTPDTSDSRDGGH
ncbi:MAG: hypothetical protein K0R57_2971 [Paenibacillaceae bacterium]|jgi:hypothetical protein|nr:hypothetical protein [Paenibacillaceae bacterium]